MMPAINFFNEDIAFVLRNKTLLRQWIDKVVRKEGYSVKELNIVFCSDKFLRKMNRHYLHHDYYTDVITFVDSKEKKLIGGEIFISKQRVKENGRIFKTSFKNELHRVIIHGVLHLMDFKDKSKRDKTQMQKKEDYYLSLRSF